MRLFLFLVGLTILFSQCSTLSLSQRESGKGFVDAQYECVWIIKYVNDTILMTQGTEDRFILKIGDDLSYGYSYLYYYTDSLFHAQGGLLIYVNYIRESLRNGTMSNNYSSGLMRAQLYKNNKKKIINVLDNISTNWFIYEEELLPQNWEILDSTKIISNLQCQKAICDYRGRNFEAWFTSEIPISEGPWKFCGLPGLIISLNDTKRHYEFELTEFKKINEKVNIQVLSTLKITPTSKIKLTKTERKKFLAMKFGNHGDMLVSADMAKVGLNHEPVVKYYDYIELDYK